MTQPSSTGTRSPEPTERAQDSSRWATASYSELDVALRTSLVLDAAPVGVRILRSPDEFESCSFPTPPIPVHYCSAVRMAGNGASLKLGREDMSCDTSPRTLGLEAGFMDDDFVESYVTAGLYESHSQAKEILEGVSVLENVAGVALAPLGEFTDSDPDVVIVSALPYSAMRLTQAAAFGGNRVRSEIIGMHGVCSECTAAPATTGQVCTSLLCSGTRHIAGWDDRLVSVGVPIELLAGIVDALMATAEKYETDERKAEIRTSCSCAAQQHAPKVAEEISGLSNGTGYFYRSEDAEPLEGTGDVHQA